ncbi:MAG: ABC transporter ATP-binding protein [Pseudomonadota bacterium]
MTPADAGRGQGTGQGAEQSTAQGAGQTTAQGAGQGTASGAGQVTAQGVEQSAAQVAGQGTAHGAGQGAADGTGQGVGHGTGLATGPVLLEAEGLTKRFGGFTAVSDVSLALAPGDRHALLGENGAGKSTLVKMLYGALRPSAGRIRWRGAALTLSGPAEARARGIGMVHQHFSLFEALSVAENVALALPGGMPRPLTPRILEVSRAYGLEIDPGAPVHRLSAGEKQRVEIIRCLLAEPQLLIMDEPTSVLTPQEAEALFETLRRLSAEGVAILYISHRLAEIRALCQQATILRAGQHVATCDPREETPESLAALMIGAELAELARPAARQAPGETRLALRGLSLPASGSYANTLHRIDLAVRAGEITGIAGVAGEGQGALMSALIGERPVAPGMIEIDGQAMGAASPTERRLAGAAFVPEERIGHAAVPEMALPENILLSHHRAERLVRDMLGGGWIDRGATRDWAERVQARFDVRAGSARPVAASLSGGNLQKFVVGREILRRPRLLVVSQPTWGVDPGAAQAIRSALIELAAGGAAVLVISQDLEELFQIADRIAVIHAGRLTGAAPVAELTAERIGLMMAGQDA